MAEARTTESATESPRRAIDYYSRHLQEKLEREAPGQAVAIVLGTGRHVVAGTHGLAARLLRASEIVIGPVFTLTIGPPTDAD